MASSSGVSATPQKKIAFSRTRPAASTANIPSSPGGASSLPHTPLGRSVSSIYGSPGGSGFRVEEENLLVFEIGSRVIRAGFAGESSPRCQIGYHPDQLRRIGDYRQYAPEYRRRKRKLGADWANQYELWSPDIRSQDLSLIGDRLEKQIREIESTYLLLDATRPRKVALVVSSQLPRPLLEVAASSLFNALQCTHVTLFPTNVTAVVAAGLRSGLVIDIGWTETSISTVYEYREVSQKSSIRGSKMMAESFAKTIASQENGLELNVEEAEDVMIRLGWCRGKHENRDEPGKSYRIFLADTTTEVAFQALAEPAEEVLFSRGDTDDNEQSLPLLAYNAILHLPVDIRNSCLARIIISGGVSAMPGLKRRFLQELESIIQQRGWDLVKNYGSAGESGLITRSGSASKVGSSKSVNNTDANSTLMEEEPPAASSRTAHLEPQEEDKIIAKIIERRQPRGEDPSQSVPPGTVRIINTLGSWNGASIVSNMRIRGLVELDKERFFAGGLVAGATKREASMAAQRQSFAGPPSTLRQVSLDKTHGALGVWT